MGPPQPVISFRLEAVPDMGADPSASPPRGEVCLRGPSLFTGYYKAEVGLAESKGSVPAAAAVLGGVAV